MKCQIHPNTILILQLVNWRTELEFTDVHKTSTPHTHLHRFTRRTARDEQESKYSLNGALQATTCCRRAALDGPGRNFKLQASNSSCTPWIVLTSAADTKQGMIRIRIYSKVDLPLKPLPFSSSCAAQCKQRLCSQTWGRAVADMHTPESLQKWEILHSQA